MLIGRRSSALIALFAVASTAAAAEPQSAAEALRPFYAALRADLPVAPPGLTIDPSRSITRIAVGSCNHQDRDQGIWSAVAAKRPDLFLMIGDNVYGDIRTNGDATLPMLTSAYSTLTSRPEFQSFRQQVPMLAVWDDHDFGLNDAGGSFAFKEYAEKIFESYWGSAEQVRSRPGVYQDLVIGPEGQRLQIILLDTRFFRSDLRSLPYQPKAPPLGWYIPNEDPQATMLGEAQWRWLEQALETPADIRLIISSVQLITDAHGFESWHNFPRERDRFYRLLADKKIDNAVLLSGDRHRAAIHRSPHRPGLHELTASSLNFAFGDPSQEWIEPDPSRLGPTFGQENFGMVEIDWSRRSASLSLHGSDGALLASQKVDIPRR